ncbi:MAG: hypothetical protein KCHDKBKB_00675 [Elusimicrobia bacterium]|nr:hypothetical protein [Elusimicrobiota bacterium]
MKLSTLSDYYNYRNVPHTKIIERAVAGGLVVEEGDTLTKIIDKSIPKYGLAVSKLNPYAFYYNRELDN